MRHRRRHQPVPTYELMTTQRFHFCIQILCNIRTHIDNTIFSLTVYGEYTHVLELLCSCSCRIISPMRDNTYMRYACFSWIPSHARWDPVIGLMQPGAKELMPDCFSWTAIRHLRTVPGVAGVRLLHEMHAITPSQAPWMQLGIDLVRCLLLDISRSR